MARFFIDRPIFAWVIAIVIMLAGGLAITSLPVSMYPDVAPPNVQIRAHYPGASAQVVEESVTQVIEQNMKGLDGLLYFSSNSSSNGQVTISLTFQTGTDPDTAQVQVQNQLQLAMPRLPQEVQRQGVNVAKSTTNFLRVVGFVSEDGSMSQADISDYVAANLWTRSAVSPALVTFRCLAPNTPCAFGSTRTNWILTGSAFRKSLKPFKPRTLRLPWVN